MYDPALVETFWAMVLGSLDPGETMAMSNWVGSVETAYEGASERQRAQQDTSKVDTGVERYV